MSRLRNLQGVPPTLLEVKLRGRAALQDLSALQHCTALQSLSLADSMHIFDPFNCSRYNHRDSIAASLSALTPVVSSSLTSLTIQLKTSQRSEAVDRDFLSPLAPLTNLVHLIYRNKPYEGHYKDYEFSASSMRQHWQSGREDMRHTLAHPHWLDAPTPEHPFVTHDVHRP